MKRLPTKEEFDELINKCKLTWTTVNNVKGCKVIGKNGNSIFLPATGYCYWGSPVNTGTAFYWSSTLNESNPDCACLFEFGSECFDDLHWDYAHRRAFSFLVRFVSDTDGVDLGLSIKWLPCNEGANKPEERGKYYTYDEANKLSNNNNIKVTECMNNMFEDAYFGKLYKTRDDRQASFIGWDSDMTHVHLYVKERDIESYGEEVYELDGTTLGGSTPRDIVSEYSDNRITIKVPDGKEAKQIKDKNGNILIKFVNSVACKSKTWAEFCKNHPNTKYEYFINQHGGIDFRTGEPRDFNNLATAEDAKAILALIQLTRLYDDWIGDWKPSYETSYKYWAITYVRNYDNTGEIEVIWAENRNYLLTFPTEGIAKEFSKCFEDLIRIAKRYI